MCHVLLQDPSFFTSLFQIDLGLAEEIRAAGCSCGGQLHCADYERKPKGCAAAIESDYAVRFSFCCDICRKRTTPPSVRFLGRRVYVSVVVVLASIARLGMNSAQAAKLERILDVPVRTVGRWKNWWQTNFGKTRFWQSVSSRFVPPISTDQLPANLLERFQANNKADQLRLLLRFLAPLSASQ
jgi:hypothetical protein